MNGCNVFSITEQPSKYSYCFIKDNCLPEKGRQLQIKKRKNYSPCNFKRPKPKARPTNVIPMQTTAADIISFPIPYSFMIFFSV